MVDAAKRREYEAFADRLRLALDERGCPRQRGRVKWLSTEFGPSVKYEAVRKWLEGVTMPDQGNLARLARILRVTPQWLQSGQEPRRPSSPDAEMQRLQSLWSKLDDTGRHEVLRYAEFRAERPLPLPSQPDLPIGRKPS